MGLYGGYRRCLLRQCHELRLEYRNNITGVWCLRICLVKRTNYNERAAE